MPRRLGKIKKEENKNKRKKYKYLRHLRLSGVETIMSHYTVGYHDSNRQQSLDEICEVRSF